MLSPVSVLLPIVFIVVILFVIAVSRNVACGFGAAIVVTILTTILGGNLIMFWDMPGLLLVGCTVVILVGGQGKWKLFLQGLRASFSVSPIPNNPDAAEIASLFRYVANGILWGGGLWMLTGLILMSSNYISHDPPAIFLGIGVSALPFFYSLIFSLFLFNPIAYRIEQTARSGN